jgi:hypothetical protein
MCCYRYILNHSNAAPQDFPKPPLVHIGVPDAVDDQVAGGSMSRSVHDTGPFYRAHKYKFCYPELTTQHSA